jgi:hypothetical protein
MSPMAFAITDGREKYFCLQSISKRTPAFRPLRNRGRSRTSIASAPPQTTPKRTGEWLDK